MFDDRDDFSCSVNGFEYQSLIALELPFNYHKLQTYRRIPLRTFIDFNVFTPHR